MEKPKRPASGFLLYLSELRNKMPRGDLSYREWQRDAAVSWSKLSDEQKKQYNKQSSDGAVKYKQELAKWELKMIRMGNVDLVRSEALVEPNPRKTQRNPRARSE